MGEIVAAREISPVELVSAHLKQIERINPTLNAVVDLLGEQALAAARQAEKRLAAGRPRGPLEGVPFSVKDSIDVAGVKTTAGTLGRRDAEPRGHECDVGGSPVPGGRHSACEDKSARPALFLRNRQFDLWADE